MAGFSNGINHRGQLIMRPQSDFGACRCGFKATVDDVFEQGFHFMGDIGNGANLGHACAALEGMQFALELFYQFWLVRIRLPLM